MNELNYLTEEQISRFPIVDMKYQQWKEEWYAVVKDQDITGVRRCGDMVEWCGENLRGWNQITHKRYLDYYLKQKGLSLLPELIDQSQIWQLWISCYIFLYTAKDRSGVDEIVCENGHVIISRRGSIMFSLSLAEWQEVFKYHQLVKIDLVVLAIKNLYLECIAG